MEEVKLEFKNSDLKKISTDTALEELNNVLHNGIKIDQIKDDKKTEILQAILKYKRVSILNYKADNIVANLMGIFVKDIYNSSLHFFLELIQNSDDACKNIKNASLSITIDKEKDIVFEYDDRGFDFNDLMAITSLGNSTKKAKLDSNAAIGEKGIGFKSIFSIADKVEIKSKHFSFAINSLNENSEVDLINILEPCDVSLETNETTVLKLILKAEKKDNAEFLAALNDWSNNNIKIGGWDNPFIFLKNIRKISFKNENEENAKTKSIEIIKKEIDDKFTLVEIDSKKYITYTEMMSFDKAAIIGRWEHLKGELDNKSDDFCIERPTQICFPCETESETESKTERVKGKIYSYLPTNIEFKMPVFINLDVHLTASRGNISTEDFANDSDWNKQVESNLCKFLINAYNAIVATHSSGVDYGEDASVILETIRENLYKYIVYNDQIGMYSTQLNEFVGKIKSYESIYLTNGNNFVTKAQIHFIIKSCGEVYSFLSNSKQLAPYPKTLEWNIFLDNNEKQHNIYSIVADQGGIADYYNKLEDKEDKVVINKIFELVAMSCNVEEIINLKNLNLVLKEVNEKFEIVTYNSGIANRKNWFFHSKGIKEDTENSIFIKSEIFDKADTFYETKFLIQKYNLVNFFDKKIDELSELPELTVEKVKEFIVETFPFYSNSNVNPFEKSQEIKKIKSFMSHYTIGTEDFNNSKFDNERMKSYIEALNETKIKKWDFSNYVDNNFDIYFKYLMFLGLKTSIQVKDNCFDEYSMQILKENKELNEIIQINEKHRTLELNQLQEYFFIFINDNIKVFDNVYIREFCENINTEGREIFLLENLRIASILTGIDDVPDEIKKDLHINKSSFCIINCDNYKYDRCYNHIKFHQGDVPNPLGEFINSYKSKEFIHQLFMMNILNTAFDEEYKWGRDNDPLPLKVKDYIGIYKYFYDSKYKLYDLMVSGYKITEGISNLKNYFKDYFNDDFEDVILGFLSSIEIDIEDIRFEEIACFNIQNITEPEDGYYHLNNSNSNNNKYNPEKILININNKTSVENKTPAEIVIFVLNKIYNKNIRTTEQNEIKNFFGELIDKPPTYKAISSGGSHFAKGCVQPKELPDLNISVFDSKMMLLKLCESYGDMEGYGYNCPICAKQSHAGLSGMKYKPYIKNGKNFYIVSCLDCNQMLIYSKDIEFDNFDEILKKFKYFYLADEKHLKNHSKMLTVNMTVTTYNDEILNLQSKISYYNMLIYYKQKQK